MPRRGISLAMGKGSLKRIAALTALATTSMMVAGAVNVAALVGVTTPEITTTIPGTTTQVTVPSTTTTVPSTPVTPETTVTTPKVTTPKVTTPEVSTPKVSTPKVQTPKVQTPKGTPSVTGESGSGGGGSGGGGSTIRQQTSSTIDTVGGLVDGGTSGTTSGATKSIGGAGGTLAGAGGGALSGGGGAAGAGSGSNALAALGFFDGGGPGGAAGGGGNDIFGAGGSGGPGAGGGLPATLSAARARQLRSVLEQVEGCMSAIAPLDRRVLSMRAGGAGAAPLSRSQVAARLGIPARQVRLSERRGLSGLRTAGEQTGCAGPLAGGPFAVTGIGAVTLATLLASPGTGTAVLSQSGGSDYVPARLASPGAESPLAGLAGGGESGPPWLVVLFTVLFSVAIAALMRELRSSVGA